MKGQEKQASLSKGARLYVDASFLIETVLSLEEQGERARALLEQIKSGDYEAYTAALTFDEVVWVVQKKKDKDIAAEAWETLSVIPHLEIISVDSGLMQQALSIYKKEGLNPRDSIHAAAMKIKNIGIMISEDADFDGIEGIQRIWLVKESTAKTPQESAGKVRLYSGGLK